MLVRGLRKAWKDEENRSLEGKKDVALSRYLTSSPKCQFGTLRTLPRNRWYLLGLMFHANDQRNSDYVDNL